MPASNRRVTIAQYAGVVTAVAEGVPLDAALANEGVDPAIWPRAQEVWEDRLADGDEALDQTYERLTTDARERYGRSVTPLDDDLEAWLGFVRRFGATDDKVAWLTALGLRSSDVIRLHQRWSGRIADDPALGRRAAIILERAPMELPALVVGPREQRRPPEPDESEVVDVGEQRDEDEDEDAIDQEAPSAGDAPLFFGPLPGEELLPAGHPETAPKPALKDLSLGTTTDSVISPFAAGAALPFAHLVPSKIGAPPSAPLPAPKAPPSKPAPPSPSGGPPVDHTVMGALSPFAAVLPFAHDQAPAAADKAPPKAALLASEPELPPAPARIDKTVMGALSPFALGGELPFHQRAAAPQPPLPRAALPSAVLPPAKPPSTQPKPSAPQASPAAPPPREAIAGLTLAQYASLCVELNQFPKATEAVFLRYGLADRKARLTADLAWQEHLRRSPPANAEWQRLYAHYAAFWADPKNPHPGRV